MMERSNSGPPARETLPDQEPAVDAEALAVLRGLQIEGEPDALPEFIGMFLTDAGPRLTSLREGIHTADAPIAASAAHALLGSCSLFGAQPMARLCAQLQTELRAADLTNAPDLLVRLEAEYARVRTALEEELSKA